MVRLILTVLLPLAYAAALPRRSTLDPRQLVPGGIVDVQAAYKIEEVEPEMGVEGAKRLRFIYGPYKLRAANDTTALGNPRSMDAGGTGWTYMVGDDFPADITILAGSSEIVTPDLQRATTDEGIYTHHNVFTDVSKALEPVWGCDAEHTATGRGRGTMGATMLAGATETRGFQYYNPDADIKGGYYLSKDRMVINSVDVVNYNNEEKEVYTLTELEFLDGQPEGWRDATQRLIEPGICGGPRGTAIHPPEGQTKFTVESEGIVVKTPGVILSMSGHVRDGGVGIILKVNDKLVCNSTATYGGAGHTMTAEDGTVWETIAEMNQCWDPVEVKAGDSLYVKAWFDTELHPSRQMAGGSMMMPKKKDEGPEAEQMAWFGTMFVTTE